VHIHDTYFIVGHFHYVMFGGTVLGLIAGLLYWFPKMFGRMYNHRTVNIALGIFFVGFNLLYFSMLVVGWMGMPRRYYDYTPEFQPPQVVSTVGSWFLAAGLLILIVHLFRAARHGELADANPWGGSTLEWTVPSPPIQENFEVLPEVKHGAYYYGGAD
jgi:cytochrome c oxidase subunit 1